MILAENSGSSTVNVTRNGGDWYDGGQYREVYMHTWTANTSCVKKLLEYRFGMYWYV